MLQRSFLCVAPALALLLVWGATAPAGEKGHHAHFTACAKACLDCARECDSCFAHCAHLVADGKVAHVKTMHLCRGCAELCTAAGRLSAAQNPLAGLTCEACAKACDQCGAACEKHRGDAHMQACARACHDCAKACRDMVKHLHHHDK